MRVKGCVGDEFDCYSVSEAALCITTCIPACIFIRQYGHRKLKVICTIILFLFCLAVTIACSRIAIITTTAFVVSYYFNVSKKFKLFFVILVAAIIVCMLKTDSNLGRIFILHLSVRMICEHPWIGWGQNGFEANYMNKQAEYFLSHPTDYEHAMLADNIHHPLNEFVLIAVNYGILGLLICVVILVAICTRFFRHPTEHGRLGFEILICLFAFSMVSYPFYYYFTWISVVFAICLLYYDTIRKTIHLVPFIALYLTHNYVNYNKQLVEWRAAMDSCQYIITSKTIEKYQRLYLSLKGDVRFLYNYAYELYMYGKYEEALNVATECNKKRADYDLCLLIGDIHLASERHVQAIDAYTHAHYMCPNRFAPLCAIYEVYKNEGNKEKCKELIRTILDKPIKVKTQETMDYVNYIQSEQMKFH